MSRSHYDKVLVNDSSFTLFKILEPFDFYVIGGLISLFGKKKRSDDGQLVLDEWETAVINILDNKFIRIAKVIWANLWFAFLPRSTFGNGEVMQLLQISKGSANQGLRALRQLGAVSSTFSAGDRKKNFMLKSVCESLLVDFFESRLIHILIRELP